MSNIKEGQKVKLYVNTVDGHEKELNCLIKAVYPDRLSLEISKEIFEQSQYLDEGNEVPVKIFTPIGILVFNAVILNSPYEQEFVIEYIENATQIQRREYVRVPFVMKILIEMENKSKIVTRTIDISGGGIKFFYEGDLISGEVLKVTLYLPEERSVQAKGIIVENNRISQNEYVLSFIEIEEKERDRIIKQCFDVQLGRTT